MQATVHTAIKRRLRPHSRWILKPFLRSTLQNCLSSRRQIHHTGRRDFNKRQLQLDTMHADEPTLTKASQKCKIALGTCETFAELHWSSSLLHPRSTRVQAAQDLRSRMLDDIESNHFSNNLAELQVRKSEVRHQETTQENKFNKVSFFAHWVAPLSYAQGRTSLLTSLSFMCTGLILL